jgi:uncharacterized protein
MPEPNSAHGRICYVIMPTKDPEASSGFNRDVFGWQIRAHGDGTLAFDAVGQVSGCG